MTSRVAAAILGGFALTTALAALSAVALPLAFGMQRSEAALLSAMLGFIVYLVLLLWAFSAPSLTRVWTVMAVGAAAAFTLAKVLAPLLYASGG